MPDDDPQVSGRAGGEPAAQVVGRVGREVGLLLAGGGEPPAEPLGRQVGVLSVEAPGAGPDENLAAELVSQHFRKKNAQ